MCGRGPQFGHKVSPRPQCYDRRWNLNLQSVEGRGEGRSQTDTRLYVLHSQREDSESGAKSPLKAGLQPGLAAPLGLPQFFFQPSRLVLDQLARM